MREGRVKPQVQTLRVRVDRQPSGRVRGCLVPLGVCHERGGRASCDDGQIWPADGALPRSNRFHSCVCPPSAPICVCQRCSIVLLPSVLFVTPISIHSPAGERGMASQNILSGSAMCVGLLRLSWLVRERSLVWPLLLRYRSCRRVATGCVPVGFSRSNSPARVVAHALTGPQAGHWLACPLYEASRKRT